MPPKTAMEEIEGRKAALDSQILHLIGQIEEAEARIAKDKQTIEELMEVRRDYGLISMGAFQGDPNRCRHDRSAE